MPPLLGGRSFTIGPFYAKPELLIGFAAAVACTIALRFMLQATYLNVLQQGSPARCSP